METLNFKNCSRLMLEETLDLVQLDSMEILDNWINQSNNQTITEFETQYLNRIKDRLIYRADDWNEQELIENFIAPVFSLIDFNTKEYGYFSERMIKAVVDNYELSGSPDAIIAKGRRIPKIPYFCFSEYKKEEETKGDAKGQCLAAMLVAQELNYNERPIYGVVVKGKMWEFLVLKGKEYAISKSYNSTDEELFEIVKLLKHLKTIIDEYVKS